MLTPFIAAAEAGGAPIDQLALLTAVYVGGTAFVMWLVFAHRAGRITWLGRVSDSVGRIYGLPGWVAAPVNLAAASLLLLMCGGFWDIGYHADYGRDEGPLGNPAHLPMMIGFFGAFAAGLLSIGLADRRDASRAWIRLTRSWPIPVGAGMLILAAAFGMAALPLDDLWHRLFGQDVTLWSPTHFMLLGGATFSVLGMLVLIADGRSARERAEAAAPADAPVAEPGMNKAFALTGPWIGGLLSRGQRVALLGGMLVGIEGFLAEYDWGLPLYRHVWQPLFLMAGAAFVFSAARLWGGRGGALLAWVVYAAVRFVATLMPVLAGRSPSVMPLLLAAALAIELVALTIKPTRQWVRFALVGGAVCGLVGYAGEYAYSQLFAPLPWNAAMLPEALPTALFAGIAGTTLGTLFALAMLRRLPAPRAARTACVAAFAVLLLLGINASIKTVPDATAEVKLTETAGGDKRAAYVNAKLTPADAADGAIWFYVLAWQGGKDTQRVVAHMRDMGDGVWRSSQPIPMSGTWKSGLRLSTGRERGAVPLRLPADEALPGSAVDLPTSFGTAGAYDRIRANAGAELTAPASFSRPFLDDALIVLREQKYDVPQWLWAASIALIMAIYAAFILALTLGVARFARRGGEPLDEVVEVPVATKATRGGYAGGPETGGVGVSPASRHTR